MFINPSTSSQSLTITSSNTATIVTIVPGSTIRVNALVASPSAPSDWVLNSLGNTVGPASAVDNAIVRFDGTTGKLVQNSGVAVDDNNNVRMLGTSGNPVYCRFDQVTANSGKLWRAGHTGAVAGFSSFDIYNETDNIVALSAASSGNVTLGPSSFSGVHNINGVVRVVVPGATTGGFRLSGTTSESHLQFLGTNASTNGSLRFYSYRSDLSNELDVGFISGSGAWTLGNTGFGSATQQTIYGYGVSGANAVVLRNIATTSGGDIIDIQTAATSGTVSAFTMTDGAGTLCGYCTIDTTANTVSYTNTSDGRLKHLFEDFNGLELIAQMQPWKYERKVQPGKKEIGFVAQEMKLVFPQAVTVGTDELQTMGIDYSKFTPVLVKALQEQQAIIDGLKARVEALESGN